MDGDQAQQNVEDFFDQDDEAKHNPDKPEKKASKKRRKQDGTSDKNDAKTKQQKLQQKHENDNTLRKQARFYCASPEQWRTVSKYNEKRMQEFCEEQAFHQQKALCKQVFDSTHQWLAWLLDKVSAGDGFVENEILADVSLRQSLEQEGAAFVSLLENKVKIVLLTITDTLHAKRVQLSQRSVPNGGGGGGEEGLTLKSLTEEENQSSKSRIVTSTIIKSKKRKTMSTLSPILGLISDRPHVTLFVGKKGSGKTSLFLKFLLHPNGYLGKYDRIIFISPTFRSQFVSTWSKLHPQGIKVYEEVTDDLLAKIIAEQEQNDTSLLCVWWRWSRFARNSTDCSQ